MIIEPGFFRHWKVDLLIQLVTEAAMELAQSQAQASGNPPETQRLPSANPSVSETQPHRQLGFGLDLPWLNPARIQPEASPLWVMKLWAHCQDRKAWQFPGMTTAQLRAVCGAPLPPDRWRDILVECRFILTDGLQITVHQWEIVNASLVSAWANGKRGGRPPKGGGETHGKPSPNPQGSDRSDRSDRIPPIVPQGGQQAIARPSDSAAVPEKKDGGAGAPVSGMAAVHLTEQRICALFGRKQLGGGYKPFLGQIMDSLPLPEETWANLARMLAARKKAGAEPEDFKLRSGWLVNADKLAEELLGAAEIARQWCLDHSSPGAGTAQKKEARPEPPGWREWLRGRFKDPAMPATFWDLPADLRVEFEKNKAGVAV